MKDKFIGIAAVLIFVAVGIFVFSVWEVSENRQRDEQCKVAREHLKAIEIQARAMATGLSIESYAEAENNEVGKLINALETAKNKEAAEAVITEHSATVKAQVDATACRSEIARRSTLPGATTQRAEDND